jgi:UDP-GlcNAc:undecaprenyl-phosphate GlcNAc-1-phosphate transferase
MHPAVLFGLLGFVVSIASVPLLERLAIYTHVVAEPVADRWHTMPVPLLGGAAVATAVALGTLILAPDARQLWILVGGGLVLFCVGLTDDLRPLKPQTKFIFQILVAAILAGLGLQLHLTGHALLDLALTIVWIVAITNAFNLLDNMDGLAAGVAAIATIFRLAFFLADGNLEAAALAALLAGALAGFLVYNVHPASIFMGDAGSLFIGTMVAGLSLVGTLAYSRGTASVLAIPVLVLLVPIFDTAFVIIARTVAGRPITSGGRDHPSHRLVALGLSEREAVFVLYVVAALSGAVAALSYRFGLSYLSTFAALLVIGLVLLGVYLGRIQVHSEEDMKPAEGARFVTLVANISYKRQIATVIVDSALIVVAYYSAYLLRYEAAAAAHQDAFIRSLPVVIACQLSAFGVFRVYQGVWRYTSLSDLITLAQAALVGTFATVGVLMITERFEGYSRSVFVLDALLLVVFVSACRLSFRALAEVIRPRGEGLRRVIIYGAGDAGVMVLREVRNNLALHREIVGFIDDDRSKHRTTVQGVPVLGGVPALEDALRDHGVDEVIVSSSKVPAARMSEVCALCRTWAVPVMRASLRLE